jgi:hypothetical protein
MAANSIEELRHSIIGTHEQTGARLGWVAVDAVYEDDGTRRGTSLQLITGIIEQPDGVQVRDLIFHQEGKEDSKSTDIEGVAQPQSGWMYIDGGSNLRDWWGAGFGPDAMSPRRFRWGNFEPRGYRTTLEDGKWTVGDSEILSSLRAEVERVSDTPEQADRLYGAMYVRYNYLLADSYRNQLKDGMSERKPLADILLIDPSMTEKMAGELNFAQQYQTFTAHHLTADKVIRTHINDGVSEAQIPEVLARFVGLRKDIAQAHTEAVEACAQMYDSIYVPEGYRTGPGRSWPYMGVNDYAQEQRFLEAGNFGYVVHELEREEKELAYKLKEFIGPSVAVLRALAGETDLTLYA